MKKFLSNEERMVIKMLSAEFVEVHSQRVLAICRRLRRYVTIMDYGMGQPSQARLTIDGEALKRELLDD